MPKNAVDILLESKMLEIRNLFVKLEQQNEKIRRQMQKQDQQQAQRQRLRLAKSKKP